MIHLLTVWTSCNVGKMLLSLTSPVGTLDMSNLSDCLVKSTVNSCIVKGLARFSSHWCFRKMDLKVNEDKQNQ